jgi:hypothetical protein
MVLWAQAAKEVEVNGLRLSTNVGLLSTPSRLRARRTQIAGYPVLPSGSCYERQPCLPGSKANRHLKRQGISYCRLARATQPNQPG